MKVLVVGGGGREHAMAWALHRSPHVTKLYCTDPNPGMLALAECIHMDASDTEGLAAWAEANGIDLTVVGPEGPLNLGIVDAFERRGLRIFGPNRAAAEIEGSKVFAKELMRKYGIPTAAYHICSTPEEALAVLEKMGAPVVVKADGLAAGKGALVCQTLDEAKQAVQSIMVDRIFGDSGNRVVIEEFLVGEEASLLAFVDGERFVSMVPAQDHKAIYEGDKGPNTGGMGAYSPAPVVTPELLVQIENEIVRPTVEAMRAEGRPYRGVLYVGLMITDAGPKVVEFNCRFGDPEAQAVIPRLKNDLLEVIQATLDGRLDEIELVWDERPCVCVVLASGGYPGSFETGYVIHGLDKAAAREDVLLFHGGTRERDGNIVTSGGRVISVVALGDDIQSAVDRAYEAVGDIRFEGMVYRRDIAHRALAAKPTA